MYYYKHPLFKDLSFLHAADHYVRQFLTESGFDPNHHWSEGNPVLHLLLANEMFFRFRRLLSLIPQKINPNLKDGDRFGNKPLLVILTIVVSSGYLPIEFITKYSNKLEFNAVDKHGRTALHYAVILGRYDVYKKLIEHNASLKITDIYGKTPLEYHDCEETLVRQVLTGIDIDPNRDLRATSNSLKYFANRPFFIRGQSPLQQLSVLNEIMESHFKLIQYRFISQSEEFCYYGDDSEKTKSTLFQMADGWGMHLLSEQVRQSPGTTDFKAYIYDLKSNFTNKSVLQACIEGKERINNNLGKSPSGIFKIS